MDQNHLLLKLLDLSNPNIENLIRAGKKAGALGAKLSGSGRGGAVIFLSPADRSQKIAKALQQAGAVETMVESPYLRKK